MEKNVYVFISAINLSHFKLIYFVCCSWVQTNFDPQQLFLDCFFWNFPEIYYFFKEKPNLFLLFFYNWNCFFWWHNTMCLKWSKFPLVNFWYSFSSWIILYYVLTDWSLISSTYFIIMSMLYVNLRHKQQYSKISNQMFYKIPYF